MKRISLLFGLSLVLAACFGSEDNPDANKVENQEMDLFFEEASHIGEVLNTVPASSPLTRMTLTVSVAEPMHFVSTCTCFVRRAYLQSIRGQERERLDTLWQLDSLGITLVDSVYHPQMIASMRHHRHLRKFKDGAPLNLHLNTVFDWQLDANKVRRKKAWSGTIQGSYRNISSSGGKIDSLVYPLVSSHYLFPNTGSLHVNRSTVTLDMFFKEGKSAICILTDPFGGQSSVKLTQMK